MMTKTYTLPNGKKAVFEYDVCGIGKITLECMDELMSMIADRPQKVIAQITFDEEKLREIVKEAVERFKEEYEIIDRPQGEWIDAEIPLESGGSMPIQVCNLCKTFYPLAYTGGGHRFCPNCGCRMKGADDE